MQKFLDQLNDNLLYLNDEILEKTIYIDCTVEKLDYYIRGYKTRILKDMNFGDKYVVLRIKLPIYYTDKSKKKSFVHPLNCCDWKSRRTKRLDTYLLENIKESSAIGMERTLKNSICEVSDTSIIRLLKKNNLQIPTMKDIKK